MILKKALSLNLLSVIACLLYCGSASEANQKPDESLSTSENLEATSSLCELAEKCEHSETKISLSLVEELLRSGANPNSQCPALDKSVLSILVSRDCDEMLDKIMSLDDVPIPLNVNSEFQLNGRTRTALNITRRFIRLFWLRPELDDESREFLLQYSDVHNQWPLWFRMRQDFTTKSFAKKCLKIFRKAPLFSLKLPLSPFSFKFSGKRLDLSHLSPAFLEYSSAAAFSFGVHDHWSPAMAAHIRISVSKNDSEQGTVEQVFSPSPSSLAALDEHNDDRVGFFAKPFCHPPQNPLLERMRVAGRVIGVCLNSMSGPRAVSLGVPLDRVVLQRLLDPKSPITRSEALNSAICVSALQTFQQGSTLEQALQEFPSRFPRIPFEHNETDSNSNGGEAEWKDYCVALVDHMLDPEKSPAFKAMLQGFGDTIPEDQSGHVFSPDLAHHLLVRRRRISMDLLKSRISFVVEDVISERFFWFVLNELAEENPQNLNRFVQKVTGSSCLDSNGIRVFWKLDCVVLKANVLLSKLEIPAFKHYIKMRYALQEFLSNE